MPRYVVLANWTDQGIRNVKHTTERMDHGGELTEKHGSKLELSLLDRRSLRHAHHLRGIGGRSPERLPPPDRFFGQRQNHHAKSLRRGRDVGDTPEARLRDSANRRVTHASRNDRKAVE